MRFSPTPRFTGSRAYLSSLRVNERVTFESFSFHAWNNVGAVVITDGMTSHLDMLELAVL